MLPRGLHKVSDTSSNTLWALADNYIVDHSILKSLQEYSRLCTDLNLSFIFREPEEEDSYLRANQNTFLISPEFYALNQNEISFTDDRLPVGSSRAPRYTDVLALIFGHNHFSLTGGELRASDSAH